MFTPTLSNHRPPRHAALIGAAAALVAVLIWSGNTIVTKAAEGEISPGSISFYRWVVALAVLAPFVAPEAWRRRAVAFRHWKRLAVLGALGMVVYQSLAYVAAETTSAVNMGVILALMPLLSALLANLLTSEQWTVERVIGGLTSIAGLIYLTSRGDPASLRSGGLHVGDGLMLLAVLSNALYGVLLRRWSLPLTVWQQLFWQILFATVLLFPIWLSGPVSPITESNLPLILYAAIPASLIAPCCWLVGILRLGAARASLLINVLPMVVALLAWSLLHEDLHPYHALGGSVALLGVVIGMKEWLPLRARRSWDAK